MNKLITIMDKTARFIGWLNLSFFLIMYMIYPKTVDTQTVCMGIIGLAILTVFSQRKKDVNASIRTY